MNSRLSTTGMKGTPLSLSSLVAATEKDHKNLEQHKLIQITSKITFPDEGNHASTEEQKKQLVSSLLELANSSQHNTPSQLEDSQQASNQVEIEKDRKDVVLCGVCSKVFSSSDECNHHIYVVSITLLLWFREFIDIIARI